MKTGLRRFLWQVLPPGVSFGVVVLCWHAAVVLLCIKPLVLPGPGRVWNALTEPSSQFHSALGVTAQGALYGFGLSLCVGTAVGFAFSQSRIIRNSFYPYAIFLQTVPIVAIAPLIILWVGYGLKGVVVVSFIISLFPMITNATEGMISVDSSLVDLFRLHGASRWQMLWKLRLPNSVPHLITGAKTSSGLAVIGAIVGEFFVGYGQPPFGLGYLIRANSDNWKTDQLFSTVIAATLLGVCVFVAVSVVGALVLSRWYDRPAAKP